MEKKRTTEILRFNGLALRKQYEDSDDFAVLTWSVRMGYPRVTVYTTNKKPENGEKFDYNTFINAPYDFVAIEDLFDLMDEVLASDKDITRQILSNNNKFKDGVRTDEIVPQGLVKVGKTDGVMWLAVLEEGKKKIKFELLPNKYHTRYTNENEVLKDKAELSKRYASGYIKVLKRLMRKVSEDTMVSSNIKKDTNVTKTEKSEDQLF